MRFDELLWAKTINDPLWYVSFYDFIQECRQKYPEDSEELNKIKRDSRHFFEKALLNNNVALGSNRPDLDIERQPIDTVVIHHTSHKPGYRKSYLNATHLLNIYVPYFINPVVAGEEKLKDQPIWSGHFEGGRQVFYAYHWIMRMDGSFERLLQDENIGWHCGNWKINRRSIGICLDNDYENAEPSEGILAKLAGHIKDNYPDVQPAHIIGHCECRSGTICPGGGWPTSWKQKLVNYLL